LLLSWVVIFPDELRYSAEHEWVAVDGARARVGVTDYAQDALGDVVYVELPAVGLAVLGGSSCAEVESTKSVSEIYAPISGVVVEVNGALVDTPELVNQEPYGSGWIFTVEMSDPSEVDALLDAAAYRALVEEG
jgi:glycine cleavage system H protein